MEHWQIEAFKNAYWLKDAKQPFHVIFNLTLNTVYLREQEYTPPYLKSGEYIDLNHVPDRL